MSMNDGKLIADGGPVKDSQTIRARDVYFTLKGADVHPSVVQMLAQLAESNHINTKAIAEIAVHLGQMTNIISGFTTVAENLKNAAEQLTRRQANVDDDITTQ
jgi:predicted chitinase